MPPLSRRHDRNDPRREMWLVYFGDVRVGLIGRRTSLPNSVPQWAWSCGFHSGTAPGEQRSGIAETFDAARADFQEAWQELAPTLHRGRLRSLAPSARLDGLEGPDARPVSAAFHPETRRARCFCGELVTSRTVDAHIRAGHRQTAA